MWTLLPLNSTFPIAGVTALSCSGDSPPEAVGAAGLEHPDSPKDVQQTSESCSHWFIFRPPWLYDPLTARATPDTAPGRLAAEPRAVVAPCPTAWSAMPRGLGPPPDTRPA